MASWLTDVGLPPGVVEHNHGIWRNLWSAVVQHPDVNKIAFTGSAAVGKIIVKQAATSGEARHVEPRPKVPQHFFADAISKCDWTEHCSACSSIKAKFVRPAAASWCRSLSTRNLWMPWPRKPRKSTGPAPRSRYQKRPRSGKEQYERVRSYQEVGKKEAASWLAGAAVLRNSPKATTWSRLFYDLDNSARIAARKFLGPVAAVIPFEDERDAVKIADDLPYGSAAAVGRAISLKHSAP